MIAEQLRVFSVASSPLMDSGSRVGVGLRKWPPLGFWGSHRAMATLPTTPSPPDPPSITGATLRLRRKRSNGVNTVRESDVCPICPRRFPDTVGSPNALEERPLVK